MKRQDKIAVLIDAENVSKKYIKLLMSLEHLHTSVFMAISQIQVYHHGKMF